MHIVLKACLLALGSALAVGGAHAQSTNWYVAGAVTGSFLQDPDSKIDNAPTPGSDLFITNSVDSGWGGQLAVGHVFGPFRLEAEIAQVKNKATDYEVTAPISATLPQTGHDKITSYMVNLYYDIPKGQLPVQPYVGLGVGSTDVDVLTVASRPFGPPMPPSTLIDDSVNGFAWQAMAGASLPLGPRFALTAQYRWFDGGRLKGHDTRGQPWRTDIAGSNLDVGLRFRF